MVGLEELPVDVLLFILDYLDLPAVAALSHTCTTLYSVVNNLYLNYRSSILIATNQNSQQIIERSLVQLSSLGKVLLNSRWRHKRYKEVTFLSSREKYRPWMWLQKETVHIAQGPRVYRFDRTADGIAPKPSAAYLGNTDDVTRLVVTPYHVITCANDGRLIAWSNAGRQLFRHSQPVSWNECLFLDEACKVVAVGKNRAGCVQFFTTHRNQFMMHKQVKMPDRVWSVSLNEDGSSCIIGTAGHVTSPLAVYDIQRGAYKLKFQENFKVGAGVFASLWETPELILTGGYDTYLRLWDMRSGAVVRSWSDPHDTPVYSVASDHGYTVLAGTARHGRVTMYDTRFANCIELFNMGSERGAATGPVYSIQFDPCHLYAALESSIHILNFAYPGYLPASPAR